MDFDIIKYRPKSPRFSSTCHLVLSLIMIATTHDGFLMKALLSSYGILIEHLVGWEWLDKRGSNSWRPAVDVTKSPPTSPRLWAHRLVLRLTERRWRSHDDWVSFRQSQKPTRRISSQVDEVKQRPPTLDAESSRLRLRRSSKPTPNCHLLLSRISPQEDNSTAQVCLNQDRRLGVRREMATTMIKSQSSRDEIISSSRDKVAEIITSSTIFSTKETASASSKEETERERELRGATETLDQSIERVEIVSNLWKFLSFC